MGPAARREGLGQRQHGIRLNKGQRLHTEHAVMTKGAAHPHELPEKRHTPAAWSSGAGGSGADTGQKVGAGAATQGREAGDGVGMGGDMQGNSRELFSAGRPGGRSAHWTRVKASVTVRGHPHRLEGQGWVSS